MGLRFPYSLLTTRKSSVWALGFQSFGDLGFWVLEIGLYGV